MSSDQVTLIELVHLEHLVFRGLLCFCTYTEYVLQNRCASMPWISVGTLYQRRILGQLFRVRDLKPRRNPLNTYRGPDYGYISRVELLSPLKPRILWQLSCPTLSFVVEGSDWRHVAVLRLVISILCCNQKFFSPDKLFKQFGKWNRANIRGKLLLRSYKHLTLCSSSPLQAAASMSWSGHSPLHAFWLNLSHSKSFVLSFTQNFKGSFNQCEGTRAMF